MFLKWIENDNGHNFNLKILFYKVKWQNVLRFIDIIIEELIPISKMFFGKNWSDYPKSVLSHFSDEANKFYDYIKLLQRYNLSSLSFIKKSLNR